MGYIILKGTNIRIPLNRIKRRDGKKIEDKRILEKVELIQKSGVEGMLSYLCGQTAPVKNLLKYSEFKPIEICAQKIKFKLTKYPIMDTFFAKKNYTKDGDNKNKGIFELSKYNWGQAKPFMQILKPVFNQLGAQKLKDVHVLLFESRKDELNIPAKDKKTNREQYRLNTIEYLKKYKIDIKSLEIDFNIKDFKKIPKIIKQILDNSEKINQTLDGNGGNLKYIKIFSLNLIKLIADNYKKNSEFKRQLDACKNCEFSIFYSANPAQAMYGMVENPPIKYSVGKPEDVLLFDCDFLIEDPTTEIVELLKNGPQFAHFGDGGLVKPIYYLYSDSRPMDFEDYQEKIELDIKQGKNFKINIRDKNENISK